MQPNPESDFPSPTLTLVKRLSDCWARYRAELKRIRSEFAEEYVHDLRVSIRRLIVIMGMGRAVTGQKKVKRARILLKSQLDAFDKLRDTQVQLVITEEMQEELPEIIVYRDFLREREKQQILHLQKKIKEFSTAGLSQRVTRLENALLAKSNPEVRTAVWSAVDRSYARVLQSEQAIQPENTASIHQVRLAFKKFRYRVESIHPLLPHPPEDLMRRLHDYQAAMGEIQDVEVGLQMLDSFIARSGVAIPQVRTKFAEMHQARIDSFLDQAHNPHNFWRAAPDQPFPWESP